MRQLLNVSYALSVENLDRKERLVFDAELVAPPKVEAARSGGLPAGTADILRMIQQARR